MAQWARLKLNVPNNRLNPGCWYPVRSVDRETGMVRVRGDEPDSDVEIHSREVRLSDRAPAKAIIYVTNTFQAKGRHQKTPQIQYRARCPARHDLGEVAAAAPELFCAACEMTFQTTRD